MRHRVSVVGRRVVNQPVALGLAALLAITSGLGFLSETLPTLHVQLNARAHAAQSAQKAGMFRIVVIEGENASNIIDQKTAVAPIVEVRDRNDLPVVGATVTFALRSGAGRAALNNGLRTVTMTTDAAGRATVAVNPLSRGAIQLQVNAVYQGETATASITQTNFATTQAAQAANASGGAAGGGGGLSTVAIAGIAGAAAVGTIAAVKVATRKEACVFAVSPTSFNAGSGGGIGTINVTAEPLDCEPATWSASSSASFITVSPTSGTGNGSVTMSVGPNSAGSAARTGTVTVAGQTVTVSQAALCSFSAAPTSFTSVSAGGGSLAVGVTVGPSGCTPATWSTFSNSAFLSVTPSSGTNSGTATIVVAANTVTAARTGSVSIAGQTVSVAQVAGAPPCNSLNVAGGNAPESRPINLGRPSGTFRFSYDTFGIPDRMVLVYEGRQLFDTGCVGTNGTRTTSITFSGTSTIVTVNVTPNCTGTSSTGWEFTVSCP